MQALPAAPRRLLAGLLLLAGCAWVGAPEPPPDSAAVSSPWAPEAAAVVVANRGLRVPLGRSAWLDPARDLVLQVQPGDRCHLTVLDEEPSWQRPGRLSPRRFPCDFGAREVQYSHLGGRSPARDRVRLQLRYDSPSRSLVLPLVLEVEVLFTQLEIVTRNLPLTVERLRGTSNPLDARSLEFAFEPGRQRCRVGLLPPLAGLPRYGEILNSPAAAAGEEEAAGDGPVPASMWDCEEFLRLGLRYRHTAASGSPNRDLVPLVAELREAAGSGALLKREYFQVLVRIRAGTENVAPKPSFLAMLMMEVDQFVLTALTPDMLAAEDAESPPDLLLFNITSPFGPGQGHMVSTDDRSLPVSSFSQRDVRELRIAYQPPVEDSDQERLFELELEVLDPEGAASEPFAFVIVVKPMNTLAPVVTRNTGLVLYEGQSRPLSGPGPSPNLVISDEDDLEQVRVSVVAGLRHGHLTLLEDAPADIRQGRVVYVHSGAETNSDTCRLDVSDGIHFVPITLKVNVHPVDDEVPMLRLPPGTLGSYLDVLENGAAEITANVIQGTDEDTDDLMLTFIVEDPPQHGNILVQGVPAERFSQKDLLDGTVVYAHTGGEIGLLPKEDTFNLTLSDLSEEWSVRGNVVQGVLVLVTILPVDSQAPEIFVGEQFTVTEGDKRVITPAHLRAEDVDTPSDDILCTILAQPTSGYVENISPAPGSEKSRAGIAISAFTLKDLRQGHIFYVQSIHKGVEPVEDRFAFRCSDGINFSQRHFFPIVIMPINDEEPEIFMREFVVMEGMSLVVDTPILNAADADIPADELMFTITRPPRHGHVVNQLVNGTVLVESFTLDQITENSNILYEHDDSETKEDSFEVKLTDGKHTIRKTVFIMVIPVDDETPRMAINDGLEIEIGETRTINNRILKATDLDSEDKTLTYIIRYGPGQGVLQRIKPSAGVENITLGMNFTQDEVDRNLIQYIHFGQEGVRDLIKFDVTDGINPLIDRYFYVTIGSTDIVFPDVISKGVSLKEGGKVTLTTDLLSTSDLNSPDENLVFTITRAPVRGHLECTDQPGVPISTFTQLLLAGNKIYYIHTSEDEVKMDSFEFEVTDGYNPVFRTFRISISDVDNKKPVITIHNLVVSENEYKLITPFELTAEDRDTPDALLKFIITQIPVHGQIMFNSSKPVTTFTKQDLNENLISYKHDGTESVEDSFSFTVTDGTHSDFYVFPNTTLRILPTGHIGFLITNKVLKVEDRDSLQVTLKIRITESPRHGFLIHLGKEYQLLCNLSAFNCKSKIISQTWGNNIL
uniref:FRAS1 related extracellular matrix 2 n=1 Tax=Accipiter nisus TaxID=211598 RepID=A0A8B9N4L5_9AVES